MGRGVGAIWAATAVACSLLACGLTVTGALTTVGHDAGPTPPGAAAADDAADDASFISGPDASLSPLLRCDEPSLIAFWRFDEGTGETVNDCTSGAHQGVRDGPSHWTTGRFGPALEFDGGGGSIPFGNPTALDLTTAMTVSAWVRITSFAGNGRIVSKSGGPNNRGWELNLEGSGIARFRIAELDGVAHVEAGDVPVPTNAWLHLAGVFQPSVALRLYVNGVERVANLTNVPATNRSTPHQVMVANRPGDACCPLAGAVDQVRIFSRALEPGEIAILAAE